MRTHTTTPDTKVNAATVHIAAAMPNISATTPATNAPTANPASRQNRYTPTDDARFSGAETSAMAASNVGYTSAVPAPSDTEASAHQPNVPDDAITPIASACIIIPTTMGFLRPTRSLSAPVTTCPTPQTAGY